MNAHHLALAYALSTIAGLRSSLTLLIVGVAINTHAWAAPASLDWLGAWSTIAILAVFTVLEFVGDKIPGLDHILQSLHLALAPMAGGLTAASLSGSSGSVLFPIFAAVGGANALGVHSLRSTIRVGGSAISLGFLTPVMSIVEDGVAVVSLIFAWIAPVTFAFIALAATAGAVVLARRAVGALRRRGTTQRVGD